MKPETRKKGLFAGLILLIALVGVSRSGLAGLKTEENVHLGVSGSGTTAAGAVGTARNSADVTQFIRCTVQGFTNSSAVFCAARDAAGNSFSCTANNSTALATSVSAIDAGSRLFIFQVGGVCQQIDVTNSSEYKPKVP